MFALHQIYGEIGGDSRSMGVYDEISIDSSSPYPRIDLLLEIFTGRERFRNYPSILVEGLNSFFLKEKAIFRGRGRMEQSCFRMKWLMLTFFFFFFLTRLEKELREVSFFFFFFSGRRVLFLWEIFQAIYNLNGSSNDIVVGCNGIMWLWEFSFFF